MFRVWYFLKISQVLFTKKTWLHLSSAFTFNRCHHHRTLVYSLNRRWGTSISIIYHQTDPILPKKSALFCPLNQGLKEDILQTGFSIETYSFHWSSYSIERLCMYVYITILSPLTSMEHQALSQIDIFVLKYRWSSGFILSKMKSPLEFLIPSIIFFDFAVDF